MIGCNRVGHDGGRIGVNQTHFNALFPKGTGSLGAGVIKFTGLTNHDGSGTDDKNGLNGSISWHVQSKKAKKNAANRLKGHQFAA